MDRFSLGLCRGIATSPRNPARSRGPSPGTSRAPSGPRRRGAAPRRRGLTAVRRGDSEPVLWRLGIAPRGRRIARGERSVVSWWGETVGARCCAGDPRARRGARADDGRRRRERAARRSRARLRGGAGRGLRHRVQGSGLDAPGRRPAVRARSRRSLCAGAPEGRGRDRPGACELSGLPPDPGRDHGNDHDASGSTGNAGARGGSSPGKRSEIRASRTRGVRAPPGRRLRRLRDGCARGRPGRRRGRPAVTPRLPRAAAAHTELTHALHHESLGRAAVVSSPTEELLAITAPR